MGRLLEFPAGTVEPDEQPAETIRREIEEETGYSASDWLPLGTFPLAPGYSDELIYAFLARGLTPIEGDLELDEDEDIEVVLMTPDELEKAILAGEAVRCQVHQQLFSWLNPTYRASRMQRNGIRP